MLVLAFACWVIFMIVLMVLMSSGPTAKPADQWQTESWMQADDSLPDEMPTRVLAMTDLPPLEPTPTAQDVAAAIEKSKQAGCDAAVITVSWPSLEPSAGQYTFDELKQSVELNSGRFLFLGIQVVNTTVKDLPADLQSKSFDDPEVTSRFRDLLQALAPLLQHRIKFLSVGNETDVYLAANSNEAAAFKTFLDKAYENAKAISPDLLVGTTLTDGGALREDCRELVAGMDAHFLTYYHGQHGLEGTFKDPATTKRDLVALAAELDQRPIVFQEIGFPAHPSLGSPEKQAVFVDGVFDAWQELGPRVPMINYFMMYDFPRDFVEGQISYYGVTDESQRLTNFIGSLGLHETNGTPRPAWSTFEARGQQARQ